MHSWCFYQKAIAEGKRTEEITHKKSPVINVGEKGEKIKEVYEALTTKDILKRCVRGFTQKGNENFHAKMWARARKAKFAGLCRLQFVAETAILDHTFGYQKASLIKTLNMDSMELQQSLKKQDIDRRRHSIPKTAKKIEA